MREYSGSFEDVSSNTVICFQGIPKEFRGNMTVLLPMHLILNYCIHIVVKWLIAPFLIPSPNPLALLFLLVYIANVGTYSSI